MIWNHHSLFFCNYHYYSSWLWQRDTQAGPEDGLALELTVTNVLHVCLNKEDGDKISSLHLFYDILPNNKLWISLFFFFFLVCSLLQAKTKYIAIFGNSNSKTCTSFWRERWSFILVGVLIRVSIFKRPPQAKLNPFEVCCTVIFWEKNKQTNAWLKICCDRKWNLVSSFMFYTLMAGFWGFFCPMRVEQYGHKHKYTHKDNKRCLRTDRYKQGQILETHRFLGESL